MCWTGVGRTWRRRQGLSGVCSALMYSDPALQVIGQSSESGEGLLKVMLGSVPRKEVHWTWVAELGLTH